MVVDTDAGVDDAFALAMALRLAASFDYEVKHISTVFGNCGLEQVVKNVAKCRKAAAKCGQWPTLSKGSAHPIIKENMLDASYFHGLDGLGNNDFPDEPSGIQDSDKHSAEVLIDLLAEAKELGKEVTVVMLGPLTNLAEALKRKSSLLEEVHRLVVMGGCGNARGNVRRTTEFNVQADPEAASIVFSHLLNTRKLCTLVSWELTLKATIPWDLFDELNSESSCSKATLNHFLSKISAHSYHVEKREHIGDCSSSDCRPGAVVCDAVAMAVALCSEEEMVTESKDVNVEVELEGSITRGQTVVDWGCFDGVERLPNCRWVLDVDHAKFCRMFSDIYE